MFVPLFPKANINTPEVESEDLCLMLQMVMKKMMFLGSISKS